MDLRFRTGRRPLPGLVLKGKRRASRPDDSNLGAGQARAIWTVGSGRGAQVDGGIRSTVGTGAWGRSRDSPWVCWSQGEACALWGKIFCPAALAGFLVNSMRVPSNYFVGFKSCGGEKSSTTASDINMRR
jgi:hypothetical protein